MDCSLSSGTSASSQCSAKLAVLPVSGPINEESESTIITALTKPGKADIVEDDLRDVVRGTAIAAPGWAILSLVIHRWRTSVVAVISVGRGLLGPLTMSLPSSSAPRALCSA